MITEIVQGHVVDRVGREITDAEAHRVTRELARQGIRVEPVVSVWGVLHLWAKEPCSTAQEVLVLRSFAECTDCRIAWHGAVT